MSNAMRHVKIAVIGAPKVGKTAFIHRIRKSQFWSEEMSQIGIINDLPLSEFKYQEEVKIYEKGTGLKPAKTPVQNGHYLYLKTPSISEESGELSNIKLKQKKLCPSKKCSFMFCPVYPGSSGHEHELVDITFLDVPNLVRFPFNSLEEWEEDGAIGVRSADAYILLYDITSEKSFAYVQQIRKEIVESFNKQHCRNAAHSSKCPFSWAKTKISQRIPTQEAQKTLNPEQQKADEKKFKRADTSSTSLGSASSGDSETNQREIAKKNGLQGLCTTSLIQAVAPLSTTSSAGIERTIVGKQPIIIVVANKGDLYQFKPEEYSQIAPYYSGKHLTCYQMQKQQRLVQQSQLLALEASHIVRKCWKCNHFECSVKFDWNVTPVITKILQTLIQPRKQNISKGRDKFFKFCFHR